MPTRFGAFTAAHRAEAIEARLRGLTRESHALARIYSELHAAIQDAFNAAGVEIMSPQYHALRDGNTMTIPEGQRPADYVPPAFRVRRGEG